MKKESSLLRPFVPQTSAWLLLTTVWRRHRDLLDNASTLVASTGVTALFGFAYWAVAARLFSQRAVGYGSAAVSAMTLIGTIGMLGMGTVLIGELPRRKQSHGLVGGPTGHWPRFIGAWTCVRRGGSTRQQAVRIRQRHT